LTRAQITFITTILFSFLHLFPTIAQDREDQKEVDLIMLLKKIQAQYNCKFSYIDQEVKGIVVPKPPQFESLKESVTFLEQHTPFTYTQLGSSNIAISIKNQKYSICGFVFSLQKEVLENVEVRIADTTIFTDKNGKFESEVTDPNAIITYSYFGFKTLTIKAKLLLKTPCHKSILIPEVHYLNEVVIKDYLIKGISKNSNGSIAINYKNFGILPGLIEPDLLQTIQTLPGILSINETVSTINVRGGTNDQNLILWDGIKMYQSSHFFGLISALNPYLTKNVELFKNGSRAHYGDGVSSDDKYRCFSGHPYWQKHFTATRRKKIYK